MSRGILTSDDSHKALMSAVHCSNPCAPWPLRTLLLLWLFLMVVSAVFLLHANACFTLPWPSLLLDAALTTSLCALLAQSRRRARVQPGPPPCHDAVSLEGPLGDGGPCPPQPCDHPDLCHRLEATRKELKVAQDELERLREGAAGGYPEKFRVGPVLAQGSSCVVSLGLDLTTGGFFACKHLRTLPTQHSEDFRLEKHRLATRRHPNVVRCLGAGEGGYFFEEMVFPGSLRWVLDAFGALEERLVRHYIRQVLQGLSFLHGLDIVHGDVKGDNILLDTRGQVKLVDFGGPFRNPRQAPGTPFWMAPEVMGGAAPSAAADIWAVGVVILEMTEGQPPDHALAHTACNDMQLVARLQAARGPSGAPTLSPRLSGAARAVCRLCFAQPPEMRPSAELLLAHAWLSNVSGRQAPTIQPHDDIAAAPTCPSCGLENPRPGEGLNRASSVCSSKASACDSDELCMCLTSLRLALIWLSRVRQPRSLEHYVHMATCTTDWAEDEPAAASSG